MLRLMSRLWVLAHLLLLSVEDIKERKLCLMVILELGVTGLFHSVCTKVAPALLPGFFLLLLGRTSGEKIGYGDGYLVLALGMWMTGSEIWRMIACGALLCVASAACLEKQELPFVPFLTAAYLMGGQG